MRPFLSSQEVLYDRAMRMQSSRTAIVGTATWKARQRFAKYDNKALDTRNQVIQQSLRQPLGSMQQS